VQYNKVALNIRKTLPYMDWVVVSGKEKVPRSDRVSSFRFFSGELVIEIAQLC
jgi:hypothetical protein